MFLNKIPEKKRVASQLFELVPVSSGKGVIGRTSAYEIFLWEGSALLENLLGAIAVYVDSKESVAIWVVPNSRKKEGYELEAVQAEKGYWRLGDNRWEYLEEEIPEGNPLLITKKTYSPVGSTDSNTQVTEAALKVASSFGGRVTPSEELEGLPEPPSPHRVNKQKKG